MTIGIDSARTSRDFIQQLQVKRAINGVEQSQLEASLIILSVFLINIKSTPRMSKQQPPHIKHTLNQSKSKTAFSFAKQNRFLPEKSYSPNKFYDLPSTLSRRGSSIGIGSKTNFSRLEFVEPGRYQLSSDFQKKEKTPRFTTFGINRQEFYKGKSSCNLVGPGAYSPALLASSRSIYIASRPSAHNPKHNISAATYEVRDETWNRLSTYQNSDKSCRIKTQYYPKDILHPYNNKTPGPGAYNPNPPAPNRNRTLNIGKQYLPKPQKPSKVGPGSYNHFSQFDIHPF